jgi:hypothetical protein
MCELVNSMAQRASGRPAHGKQGGRVQRWERGLVRTCAVQV